MRIDQPLAGQGAQLVSHELSLGQAPEGYQRFDDRGCGWTTAIRTRDHSKGEATRS